MPVLKSKLYQLNGTDSGWISFDPSELNATQLIGNSVLSQGVSGPGLAVAALSAEDSYPLATVAAGSAATAASATAVVASIPTLADYLINGFWSYAGTFAHHWANATITYSLGVLNTAEQFLATSALNAWHEVTHLTFVPTAGSANIAFNHNGSMEAYETDNYSSSGVMSSATVDISADWITTDGGAMDGKTGIDSYGYQTYLHEIGHALGLGHQGPYNGSASYSSDATYADDTWQYSVMSYFSQQNFNGGSYRYVTTPEMADIYAVDLIYGASTTTRAGNTTYGFHCTAGSIFDFSAYSQAPALTLYDSGGSDTLDCSGYSVSQTIDLHAGSFSSVGGLTHNIGIAFNTAIENAIGGSGNDVIIGNDAGDNLNGGAGNDILTGGAGNDTLTGGLGNDRFDGGAGSDRAVFSGARSGYTFAYLTDGSTQISGNDGVDSYLNLEFLIFDDQTISAPTEHAPVVMVANLSPGHGQTSLAASSLFSVTDADGDVITSYHFWDSTADAVSGHFAINGVAQGTNQNINVSSSQLAQTTFLLGSAPDDLWVQAYDGIVWSAWKEFQVSAPVNHAPVANLVAAEVSTMHGQTSLAASSLFSMTDADGDAITSYHFWDSTTDAASGHFAVNGVAQGTGQNINVSASQLAQTTFQLGSVTDDLWIQGFDGGVWGAWKEFHVNAPVNHAPVVTVSDVSPGHGTTSIAASSLFSASDADSDSITAYRFWDSTEDSSSGHWSIGGVAQDTGRNIDVSAAQLSQTTLQLGSVTDDLWVQSFDGLAWGAWKEFHVNAPVNSAPMVAASDVMAAHNQNVAASALFSISDGDGDAVTKYQFWDSTVDPASGHFTVGGVAQGTNQNIDVSAAQLPQTSFQGGSGSDDLWVRGFDSSVWGTWKEFHFNAPVDQAPVVAVANTSMTLNSSVAVSSLFSVSDFESDAIANYQFWDSTADASSAHFEINGVAQGTNQNIDVLASLLSQTTLVAGSAAGVDTLWVRANDGSMWSDWHSFTGTSHA